MNYIITHIIDFFLDRLTPHGYYMSTGLRGSVLHADFSLMHNIGHGQLIVYQTLKIIIECPPNKRKVIPGCTFCMVAWQYLKPFYFKVQSPNVQTLKALLQSFIQRTWLCSIILSMIRNKQKSWQIQPFTTRYLSYYRSYRYTNARCPASYRTIILLTYA